MSSIFALIELIPINTVASYMVSLLHARLAALPEVLLAQLVLS